MVAEHGFIHTYVESGDWKLYPALIITRGLPRQYIIGSKGKKATVIFIDSGHGIHQVEEAHWDSKTSAHYFFFADEPNPETPTNQGDTL